MADEQKKQEVHPHRVNFLTNHPLTGDILYPGDVVRIPLEAITPAMMRDGVFQRLSDSTPENHIPRDREHVVGVTISEDDYETQKLADAAASKVSPGMSEDAKRRVMDAQRSKQEK